MNNGWAGIAEKCTLPQFSIQAIEDLVESKLYQVVTDMICMDVRLTDYKFVFLLSTMTRRRQNTILVKVPGPEESQEDQESGSEASDSVSNGGQPINTQNGQNVTLITLNSEGMTSEWLLTQRQKDMYMNALVSS